MKVSVVGAGPIGCRTAELLALSGHKVQVFEEHPKPGLPEHCTGIVSPRLLDLVKTESVLNKPSRASVFGEKISFSVKGTAYVIDRPKFDQERFEAAQKAGAVFFFDSRTSFDGRDLVLKNRRLKSDIIVAADGARSSIRSFFRPNPLLLPSAQYLVSGRFDPGQVEIHFWPHYNKPGLFTWVVPQSGEMAKLGVACQGPLLVLDAFMKKRAPKGVVWKRMAGTVVVGGPVRQDFGKVKLVGDAAGQVKATTAGGFGCRPDVR